VALRYFGTAVGKGRQSVKNEVEKMKFDQITCREAVVEAAKMWVAKFLWLGLSYRRSCKVGRLHEQ